ncbi:MAG: hypothetical protein Q606_CBAC00334G0001, partial [Intestinibacter bartlettii DORA_8_9]
TKIYQFHKLFPFEFFLTNTVHCIQYIQKYFDLIKKKAEFF